MTKRERRIMGEKFKQARLLKDVSISWCAREIGYHRTSIWRLERGERGMRKDPLIRLCNLLGLDPKPFLPKKTRKRSSKPQRKQVSVSGIPPLEV